MSDGTIKYDYEVIDECLSLMKNKASQIEAQAGDLESQVKQIMVDWTGQTADAYNQLAQDLKADIDTSKDSLDRLHSALETAAHGMQQADASGAKTMI